MTAYSDFQSLPRAAFRVIVADPPWAYQARGAGGYGKSPQAHYGCMSAAELAAMDVASLGTRDCVLWLWAVGFALDQAVDLMRAWGFRFCTSGHWAKTSATGRCWSFGTGHVLRGASEPFLIGVRGNPRARHKGQRNLVTDEGPEAFAALQAGFLDDCMVMDRVREHSRKPDSAYRAVEALFDGPYLELFAREVRGQGWAAFGDEAEKFGGLG